MVGENATRAPRSVLRRLRELGGVLLFDYRRYSRSLAVPGSSWLALTNRYEKLEHAPEGSGFLPLWQWTSELHAPRVLPSLGRRLLKRALHDFPFALSDERTTKTSSGAPLISVIIGHRGVQRLPHLLMVLRSLAAQTGVTLECIVVEQATTPAIRSELPRWVRHIHTQLPASDMPYSRSWALNVGARSARGNLLVLHDNDFVVPRDYLAALADKFRQGFEVINLKRFIFYLSPKHAGEILSKRTLSATEAPEAIVQNLEAGGSVAIDRQVFFDLGGFDEEFVGWGGEDNELWDRAQTRRVYPFGSLPLLHLWHPPQPGKQAVGGMGERTATLFKSRMKIPPSERIDELRNRDFGQIEKPNLPYQPSPWASASAGRA